MSIHAENAARAVLRDREMPITGWMVVVDDQPAPGTVYTEYPAAMEAAVCAAEAKRDAQALVHVVAIVATVNLVCRVVEVKS